MIKKILFELKLDNNSFFVQQEFYRVLPVAEYFLPFDYSLYTYWAEGSSHRISSNPRLTCLVCDRCQHAYRSHAINCFVFTLVLDLYQKGSVKEYSLKAFEDTIPERMNFETIRRPVFIVKQNTEAVHTFQMN